MPSWLVPLFLALCVTRSLLIESLISALKQNSFLNMQTSALHLLPGDCSICHDLGQLLRLENGILSGSVALLEDDKAQSVAKGIRGPSGKMGH